MNKKEDFENFQRYEFKYILTREIRHLIEKDISNFMSLDKFAQKNKMYFVRSLYFDDQHGSEYYNKIDGMLFRKKFRLRTYSKEYDKNSPIFIEIKSRNNQRTFKKRKKIDFSKLVYYENTDTNFLYKNIIDEIDEEFFFQVFKKGIKPTVTTDYQRSPYVSEYDRNFRLTFDSFNVIRKTQKLFDNNKNFIRNSLPGYSILETKFDRRIPKWFHRIIQNYNLKRVSVSKFCLAMETANIAINLE